MSFDLERFVAECRAAAVPAAVEEVVRRAVERQGELLAAIGPAGEQATRTLYASPALTVQWLAWAPGMRAPAHDHRMWAVIGVCAGREDNGLWRRRAGGGLERSGVTLGAGDTVTLPDDVIHDVANPLDGFSIALHVYGGDILGIPRRTWNPMTGVEEPFDGARVERLTAAFNERMRREPVPFAAAAVPRVMAALLREGTGS